MRWVILVPGKHGMAALMLALKEAKLKAEDILVHTHKGKTATQHLKNKDVTPTVIVHM